MAHRALVDAHILVDPRISVSEGHNIAERARSRVLKVHAEVSDVLVHIDPEDDIDHDSNAQRMPERGSLLMNLSPLLEGVPEPQRVIFHYIAGKVEVEVYLSLDSLKSGSELAKVQEEISKRLIGNMYFSSILLYCQITTKD